MKPFQGVFVWAILTLFVAYSFCLNTASAVFSTVIKSSLHVGDLDASLATGAFIAGFALMQIPAGYLLDRYNPRWVISSGIFLLALGNLLISFAGNIWMFAVANLIQGLGGAFAFVGAAVLIAKWFRPNAFPILFGLTQTVACFVVGYLHYLFVNLLQRISWNVLYQYLSIFGFVLLLLALIIVSQPDSKKKSMRTSLPLLASLKIVCSNPQIWLCTLAAATSFGMLMAYAGFWYIKIQDFYNVSINHSLLISGLIFAGIGVGAPILGYISNLLQSRTVVIHTSLVLGNMMLLLGIYLPNFAGSVYVIYVISFLMGFFLSASELFYTIINEISDNQTRGVGISLANTGIFVMNTLMMFVPYYLMTAASTTFFTYLWVLPLGVLVSILLVYFIKESYKA